MQRESLLIANPFKAYLKDKGWHVENVHGNQFSALPFDCIAIHAKYSQKNIEFKVIEANGQIKLSPLQKKKIPIWIANGGHIWVLAAPDLRGPENRLWRDKLYAKLFEPANAAFYLMAKDRRLCL